MKKIIAIAALMAVSVAFSACDKKTGTTATDATPTSTATDTTTTATE